MSIVAIIPARKGSKRLKNKNKIELKGKPLIQYTIEAAKCSKLINRVILNTDDDEVKEIARQFKIEIVDRKKKSATDFATLQEVIKDMLDDKIISYDDTLVLLMPTSPTRTYKDIDKGLEFYMTNNFDTVASVRFLSPFQIFLPNGVFYIFKGYKIWSDNIGLISYSDDDFVDIDTEIDLKWAELYMDMKRCN